MIKNYSLRTIIFTISSIILSSIYITYASAGDEDINPSPYQRFDPETGYMIPIDEDKAGSKNHTTAPPHEATGRSNAEAETSSNDNFILWSGLGGIILGVVALVAIKRSRSHS